jgi:hypothetical protein
MPKLEVQMRHENGDLLFRNTIRECMEYARMNIGIWKISWTDAITGERIRLVRHGEYTWVYEPILLLDVDEGSGVGRATLNRS